MSSITCILIFLLHLFNGINSQGYYTISAPRTIRENSSYYVAVSVHDSPGPCSVKVGLHGTKYKVSTTVDVKPYSTELVQLQSPRFKDNYNLTIEGTDGIIFQHEITLNFSAVPFIGLIQTDRAIYKPNDLVRYRVLVLDQNTKPEYNAGSMEILIEDGKENEIKLVKNVKLTQGVYSGEVQLSSKPVLGDWKIIVDVDGHKLTKDFEVANYILPKFEVLVETAENAFFEDQIVHATIRAKYTFGKPVKGEATILVYGPEPESYLITRKVVQLDGKARIEFRIENDLHIPETNRFNYILIDATVEEKITGLKQNGSAIVNIQKNKYLIKAVKMPNIYVPGVAFEVKVQVTTLDGKPVEDDNIPVKAGIFINENRKIRNTESYLDRKGIATFEFRLPARHDMAYAHVIVTYRGVEQNIGGPHLYEGLYDEDLQIEILTDKLTIDGDVSVAVTSNIEINYLMYQVIGRGDILLSKIEQFADTNHRHVLEFPASFAMAPNARLYVSTIHNGELYFDEQTIDFGENLLNYINIEAPSRAGPGDNVQLTVTTNRDSYVGLLAVDQSSFIIKSGNDLTLARVFHELENYNISVPITDKRVLVPGYDSGLVTFTNANIPTAYNSLYWDMMESYPLAIMPESDTTKSAPFKTRSVFPESWIWESFDVDNTDGQVTLQKKVPDTITSWIITGFSLNPETGLGLTKTPGKIQVFQPFFVSTDLPYSVKRGEVVSIPIVVFNYMDKNLEAEVTLDNADQEFEFTEAINEIVENPASEIHRTKHVAIPSNTGQAVSFMIRPNKVGHIKIKVTATTPIAGDSMERMLLVEAEGVTEYINKASFADLREQTTKVENFKIEIPDNVVPDSTHIEVSVVGDIVGPTVNNLDQLVRLPYGCGEQNMVNFVPNIMVLKYLTNIDKLNPVIESKAKNYLELGYQSELTYKHRDGSFSAFGPKDKGGSTWLTAYVARSFRQAAEYINIEEDIIKSALKFLARNQANDGSFPEVGIVLDRQHSSGSDKGVALTAFTVLAFIENDKHIPEYRDVIIKALDFISSNTDASSGIYPLAISSYALQLADHSSKTMMLEALQSRATNDDEKKYWNIPLPHTENRSPWSYRPRSVNVEVTSYAFLAMVEAGHVTDLLPVFKWLVSQRNANGGFESTQDTVVGLQALIKAGEKLSATEQNLEVIVNFGEGVETRMTINNDTAIVLQSHEIPPATKDISVSTSGHGVALVQLSYKYNVNVTEEFPRFTINPQISSLSTPDHLYLTVCTSFVPQDGDTSTSSNMAVMEVNLPSGFTIDSENLSSLEKTDRVKKVESKKGETVVVIYFDNLDTTEICPKIEAFKTHRVAEQKPAAIIVYDYYDNSRQAREFYSAPTADLCGICEGSDCGKECGLGRTPLGIL